MKKMAEQISFLVHAQKFSINIQVHMRQSETFYEQTYLEQGYEEI